MSIRFLALDQHSMRRLQGWGHHGHIGSLNRSKARFYTLFLKTFPPSVECAICMSILGKMADFRGRFLYILTFLKKNIPHFAP